MTGLLGVRREHVITGPAVPDNLILSVSCESDREQVQYILKPHVNTMYYVYIGTSCEYNVNFMYVHIVCNNL